MNEHNVDLNQTECIVEAWEIGSWTIINVCSGKISSVPWGTLAWIGLTFLAIFVIVIMLLIMLLFISVFARMAYDVIFGRF